MDKVKEATKLVDDVFDNPAEFKKANIVKEAEGMVDKLLEDCGMDHGDKKKKVKEVENKLENEPSQDAEEETDRLKADVGGEDAEDKEAIEGATDMIEMYMMKEEMTSYQQFVQAKLKASGYSSPAKMPPDKRKAFFSSLSKEWKAKKAGHNPSY